ncbi:MAG: dihydrofolate reductase family protein [Candidatus Vogelbacteria bacterium]|nr:dihydrofolate reductase family protein [Candidatus Vogelbacteria bacterium]
MKPINKMLETLIDRSEDADILTPELNRLYGGALAFPKPPPERPFTMVNFVTTLEGLTSFALPGQAGGGDISAFNGQDKFIMGVLRAIADGVAVGANTLRTEGEHLWTPDYISPDHASLYTELRSKLKKKQPQPVNIFVTASGRILPVNGTLPVVFETKDVETLILTTKNGKQVAEKEFAGHPRKPRVVAFGSGEKNVDLQAAFRYLRREAGISFLLIEGGASFNGAIVEAELYDELLLTRAPQVIGTSVNLTRPLFVNGFSRSPATALWHTLVSVKVSGDYLFERYRRQI